jgi:hypothetical protein
MKKNINTIIFSNNNKKKLVSELKERMINCGIFDNNTNYNKIVKDKLFMKHFAKTIASGLTRDKNESKYGKIKDIHFMSDYELYFYNKQNICNEFSVLKKNKIKLSLYIRNISKQIILMMN